MAENKKITRKNLVANYKNALVKLEELKDKVYKYITNRPCTPFNEVSKLSIKECVQAYATVHDGFANIANAQAALKVTDEEFGLNKHTYAGFTIKDWDHDLMLRIEELRDKQLKEKYEKVIAVFKKNFSDDDRFEIEMSEIEALGIEF